MKHNTINNNAFTKTAPYYDAIYAGRNIESNTRLITTLLRQLLPNDKQRTLLDLGCGTGSYTHAFARLGHKVTGVDRSKNMIRVAKSKASKIETAPTFVVSDILSYNKKGQFDSVVSLFDVLSYMITDHDTTRFFNTVSSQLKPGGVFIFDCWHGPGILSSKPINMTQSYKTSEFSIIRKKTPTLIRLTNTVRVHHALTIRSKNGLVRRISEDHVLRYYFYPEIVSFASQAGLRIMSWGELGVPLQKATKASWSVYYIAKKISNDRGSRS